MKKIIFLMIVVFTSSTLSGCVWPWWGPGGGGGGGPMQGPGGGGPGGGGPGGR